jgi:hypothetical protein
VHCATHTPPEHVLLLGHAMGVDHTVQPCAPTMHVCTPLPMHCVAPGAHAFVHVGPLSDPASLFDCASVLVCASTFDWASVVVCVSAFDCASLLDCASGTSSVGLVLPHAGSAAAHAETSSHASAGDDLRGAIPNLRRARLEPSEIGRAAGDV